jgi:site-specific DNA-methyltransferase (adenine-specific)
MTELTLHNGDCLEVMKQIPAKSVDLIICDLPYGCLTNQKHTDGSDGKSKGGKHHSNTGCPWDVKIDLEALWKEIKRIRRSEHSPTLHFCTTKFGYDLIKSNPDEFRYDLVWDKQRGVSFLTANKMPMRSHEMIYVFSKAGAFYERKDITGDFPGAEVPKLHKRSGISNVYSSPRADSLGTRKGVRCALSIVKQVGTLKKGQHPTEKPTDLYKFLIERYCPAGGTVLDPTAGSCNSVFEAFRLGRNGIGIEKDEVFFKKAEERLNAL